MKPIFPMLLIVLMIALQAHSAPQDLWNDDTVLLLGADDPRDLLRLTRPIIEQGPEGQEALWVRAVWAASTLTGDRIREKDHDTLLNQGAVLAGKLGMQRESIGIRLELLDESDDDGQRETFKKLRDEAHQQGYWQLELRILRRFAYWLYDLGDDFTAVQMQKEATAIIDSHQQVPIVERLELAADIAMVFEDQDPSTRALHMFEDIIQKCRALHLRDLCVRNFHDIGLHFKRSKDPADWTKAETFFFRTLKLARDVDDAWAHAKAQAALGDLYAKQQRFPEAIIWLRKAIDAFSQYNRKIWTGDTYKRLARTYLRTKQYDLARDALEKAQELITKDHMWDHKEIAQMRASVHEAQGDWQKAVAQLHVYMDTDRILDEKHEATEYTKAMTAAGLKVEEERNKALATQNALQSQMLRDAERLRQVLLITLFLTIIAVAALVLARYRSLQLRKGEQHISHILHQIHEGIVSLDRNLLVQIGYSTFAEEIFGTELQGHHIVQHILARGHFTADELRTFDEVLKLSMEEGELTWELNQHNLPEEVLWTDGPSRLLSLQWQPMWDGKGHMTEMLLSFRDVSEQRKLQNQVNAERQLHDRYTRYLQELLPLGADKAARLFLDGKTLISQIPQLVNGSHKEEAPRRLHSLKGLARSFGLRELAQAAHACEDALGTSNQEHWKARWEDLLSVWTIYQSLEPYTAAAKSVEKTFLRSIDNHLPRLKQRCREQGIPFDAVAIVDRVKLWPEPILLQFDTVFIHAINNIVDHGYVYAKASGARIEAMHIEVTAMDDSEGITVSIRDNGCGIDWTRLRERAVKLGLNAQSEQELADLVFADGVSTAQLVSETSGRGFGMGAIRSLCKELGGTVRLKNNDRGRGALLVLHYPRVTVMDRVAG